MTFYVRIKEVPQMPNPKFEADGCYLEYNTTKKYANETLDVPKGVLVNVHVGIYNSGDAGKVAVQVWDWKANQGVLWKELTMGFGEHLGQYVGTITVNADMDLGFVLYYWDGSNWVQNDTIGCGEPKRLPGFIGD